MSVCESECVSECVNECECVCFVNVCVCVKASL